MDLQPPSSIAAVALAACCLLLPLLLLLTPRSKSRVVDANGHWPHELPSTLPVLGNLLDILQHQHRRPDWLTTVGETFGGEPVALRFPGVPLVVVVYTPQNVEDVLKTQFDAFPKGEAYLENFTDVFGHGILAVDGAKWSHQRKTASNLFTARALRETMTASTRRCTLVLVEILRKACEDEAAVDVYKLMTRFTLDAFAEMGLGLDMHCLEADEEHPFQSAFDAAQRVLVSRFQRPVWFWKLQRFLGLGLEGELKRTVAVVDATVYEMIQQILARRSEEETATRTARTTSDIVSIFLDRQENEEGTVDPKFLRDVIVNFIIAGRDSTAQAVAWLLYNLSANPQIAERLRAEIRETLPELADGAIATPTMEQVQRLTFLDATLKETLRLHPSVPVIPQSCAQNTVLSDGTFVPKNALVLIPAYSIGRLETIWGPDAKAFKPERWIDAETGKIRQESAFKFVAFKAGPRQCLGMHLAMLEMKIVVASVLSRFSIELLPGQQITYDNSMTLAVKGAMLARVRQAGAA